MTKPNNKKIAKIESWMVRELTNILRVKSNNYDLRNITVNAVRVDTALTNAIVYWTPLDPTAKKQSEIALKQSQGFIRYELAQVNNLFKTPVLIFKYDETFEKAQRLEQLMNEEKQK